MKIKKENILYLIIGIFLFIQFILFFNWIGCFNGVVEYLGLGTFLVSILSSTIGFFIGVYIIGETISDIYDIRFFKTKTR